MAWLLVVYIFKSAFVYKKPPESDKTFFGNLFYPNDMTETKILSVKST